MSLFLSHIQGGTKTAISVQLRSMKMTVNGAFCIINDNDENVKR